jgi:Tol biopolymer transport system component
VASPLAARAGLLVVVAVLASAGGLAGQNDADTRAAVREAQISPDGSSVLFTRAEAARDSTTPPAVGLWRVSFAGGDPQRVTTTNSQESRPRWSPDGGRIAFLSAPLKTGAPAQLFTMPATARVARAITPESIHVVAFEWSPSGRRIAFVSGESTSAGLWVMDSNGSAQRRLRTDDTAAFVWSPDDSAVARIAGGSASAMRVEIVPLDAAASPRTISADVLPRVSWSRDGAIALPGRRETGASRVVVVESQGLTVREIPIVAPGSLTDVLWTGDGRLSLTFASSMETWIERLTVATGERITIMPPGIATLTTAPSWSLDGTRYVVVGRSQSHAAEVFAGTVPQPETGRPDTVGARPPPVRRLTFSDR